MCSFLLSAAHPKEEGLLSSGAEIFKAVCAIVCCEEKPSLGRVVDLLSPEPREDDIADLCAHFAGLADRAPEDISRRALVTASANKNENIALYLAVLFDAGLKAWRDPAIRRATERHDVDFRDMRSRATSVYLCVPPPYRDTVTPVVRLFFQSALRALQMRLPDPETEPLPVLFMIDEFHTLGRMKEVLDAPTVIPGYGGRIMAVVQSPASLDAIYGREAARVFLDLAQIKVFMTPNDNETKRMIEETLGYRTEISRRVSGRQMSGQISSTSYSEIRRPLMAADDIGKMPETDEIVTIQGRRPLLAKRIRHFNDPYYTALHASQHELGWGMIEDIPRISSPLHGLAMARKEDAQILPEIAPAMEQLDAAFEATDLLADGGFVEALDKLDAMAAGWL